MIRVNICPPDDPVQGLVYYSGWFLTLQVHEMPLRRALGLPPADPESGEGPIPRLLSLGVGERGVFHVSPINGWLLGFELYGVSRHSGELLQSGVPPTSRSGALCLPLAHPFGEWVFSAGSGPIEGTEAGYRSIGYRVAVSRGADVFRIQFFRAGPAERYVRIASCAVAGISEQGGLSEIWLHDAVLTGHPD